MEPSGLRSAAAGASLSSWNRGPCASSIRQVSGGSAVDTGSPWFAGVGKRTRHPVGLALTSRQYGDQLVRQRRPRRALGERRLPDARGAEEHEAIAVVFEARGVNQDAAFQGQPRADRHPQRRRESPSPSRGRDARWPRPWRDRDPPRTLRVSVAAAPPPTRRRRARTAPRRCRPCASAARAGCGRQAAGFAPASVEGRGATRALEG